ncbi:MAG: 4Fe-4S binding protein, partial [Candidatus Thermoplasmatota archaeon]
GHQPHPGNEKNGMGENAIRIDIEKIVRGMGVKNVEVVNPKNIEETKMAIKKALEKDELSVIISRSPCILIEKRKEGKYSIDEEKCKKCKICITKFACPAFYFEGENIKINEEICTACGVCVQICPFRAIGRK